MKGISYMQLTAKIVLNKSSPYFQLFKTSCRLSKNLYNHALFNWRIHNAQQKELSKFDLINMESKDVTPQLIINNNQKYNNTWNLPFNFDYKQMPTAQSAQQTLILLSQNIKAFQVADKDYKKNPHKYLGKPKLPKYLPKNGYQNVIFTNQNCKIKKDDNIHFPAVFKGFTISTKCFNPKYKFKQLNQIRVQYKSDKITLFIIYTVEDLIQNDSNNNSSNKEDKIRVMGIDLGVNNLCTCTINDNLTPIIFSGKSLKSIIRFYAKRIGKYQSKLKIKQFNSKRLNILWTRRHSRIEDYLHKVSRRIVDLARLENIHTIIIGKNVNWKQKSDLNKKTNQMFQQIPFSKLIDLITYKAELLGINVIVCNENYTSGTSFLDHEIPNKQNYNKSRRITRGLFKTTNGKLINSDINGSLQIIHKAFYETINNILAKSYSNQIYNQLIYDEVFDFNHSILFNNIKIKNLDIVVTSV